MSNNNDNRRQHLIPIETRTATRFTSPMAGRSSAATVPIRDRLKHGAALKRQLDALRLTENEVAQEYEQTGLESRVGFQVEFASFDNAQLAVASLANGPQGIELSNVRTQGNGSVLVTVWVPQGKLAFFENKVLAYIEERRSPDGKKSADFRSLIDAIENIQAATFDALWTDDSFFLPAEDSQAVWWEIWLPNSPKRQGVFNDFLTLANRLEIRVSGSTVTFPERIVILVNSTRQKLQYSAVLSLIVEIRRAKDTAEFFHRLDAVEQADWVHNLGQRLTVPADDAPTVCLLDTGVSRGHPLLWQSLPEHSLFTVDPAWGVHDSQGHGTELAGLTLFGDLQEALAHDLPIAVSHNLESVKVLQSEQGNEGLSFGSITIDAVAQPEVSGPYRQRVFCLAISSAEGRDRGRPSAWSAVIDQLASDWINDGHTRRLFCISAGNIAATTAWLDYPASFALPEYGIEAPGQAWNALTVGAFTNKWHIEDEDAQHYQPIATPGCLSPFSSTSTTWDSDWPWKPDVVFEGGNAASDGGFASTFPSLSLLTTHYEPVHYPLTVTWATSAATALAANLAARIMASYPKLWPEMVRALIVHSAAWTPVMLQHYYTGPTPTAQGTNLLRHCGYGVPDLERALWSASNSLTLLVQDSLQPFARKPGKDVSTQDMHLHDLPWPRDMLEQLGEVTVKMRVTLSYFIEPSPGERGFRDKYLYQSHGLRFDVRRRAETDAVFQARINKHARDSEYAGADPDKGWMLGETLRRRGSIHSDIWEGSAVDLANRGQIAVFPTLGWWKTRPGLGRFNQKARYALTVSIEAPQVEQDIYAAVAVQIIRTTVHVDV